MKQGILGQFHSLFGELYLPVVVCRSEPGLPVAYMNVRAALMFSPTHSVDSTYGEVSLGHLEDLLKFGSPEAHEAFGQMIFTLGRVDNYQGELQTFDGRTLPVELSGNSVTGEDGAGYFVFYLVHPDPVGGETHLTEDHNLSTIISSALLAEDVDASIQAVLAMAGRQSGVSRVYIFESISQTTTRNTYEWCAEEVEPAIHMLQNLDKADYNYDVIVGSGMYITDDLRVMDPADRAILEEQGIKALAILPMFDADQPLGYVGFDDCVHYRKWSYDEVEFLRTISVLLATLLKRRNAERLAAQNQNILRIISDSSEDHIYANNLDDYRIVFANRSLAAAHNTTPADLTGRKCYEVFGSGQTAPCDGCPISRIPMRSGEARSDVYLWEAPVDRAGRTYLVKDNIVRWVDEGYVHVQTAVDISERKAYEEQLRVVASTDGITGLYKREWGSGVLEAKMADPRVWGSLCFLDVDGLKRTNDQLGHAWGDDLLRESARIICEHLGQNDFICRWGGDEFLIWFSREMGEATALIEQIQADMNRYNQTGAKPFSLAFSYGIVPVDVGTDRSLDALITAADKLMYQNKMAKRGLRRRRDD